MALIKCPECNHDVSTNAVSCPKCGSPIAGAIEGDAAGSQLTTVQETSKKFKLQILISTVIFSISMVMLIVVMSTENRGEGGGYYWILIAGVSLAWLIVTKIRIWWHHK